MAAKKMSMKKMVKGGKGKYPDRISEGYSKYK